MKNKECNTKKIEKLIEQINPAMEDLCLECKKNFASIIAFEAVVWGSENFYEAIGILEHAKVEYRKECEKAMNDNKNNEEIDETKKVIKL